MIPKGREGEGYVEGYGWEGAEVGGQSAESGEMKEALEGWGYLEGKWRMRGFEESVLDTVAVLEGAWPGTARSVVEE